MPDANTLAIGAFGNDGNGLDAGHVRVYHWDGNVWNQKGADIDGEAADCISGYTVSMPGANTIAVGAPSYDGTAGDSGQTRIFDWNGGAWVQRGADIGGEAVGDRSGYSVSMGDSNNVAIGAIYNDGNGLNAGHVRIYTWSGSAWVQRGSDIDGEAVGDHSGTAVTMPDPNTVAIGSYPSSGTVSVYGHVRIYAWDGSAWVQKGADIVGEYHADNSGRSVSMPDANTVAIGAPNNAGNGSSAGHVRIYGWDGSAWVQRGGDIDGEGAMDQFGMYVSMPDANTLAAGAPFDDNSGMDAGHVRIYTWSGGAWLQRGTDIDGESFDDGASVVSMGDANTVAIGAIGNDGNGTDAGHVRVYALAPGVGVNPSSVALTPYVFPNPSLGTVTIVMDKKYRIESVMILDPTGRLIDQQEGFARNNLMLALPEPKGVYFLQVNLKDGSRGYVKVLRE